MKSFKHSTVIVQAVFSCLVLCASAAAQQSATATFSPAKDTAVVDFDLGAKNGSDECGVKGKAATACADFKKASPGTKRSAKAPTKKPFNPLEVHADITVKDTPAKEINLPGVMKIAGESSQALDFSKVQVVELTNGGSKTVFLSNVDQNRIQLPFANPKVIGTAEVTVDKRASSNNIYLQFVEGVTRPVQIYIEPAGGGTVLGLQLVPKEIPAQTILVRDKTPLSGDSIVAPKSNDYITQTQAMMETVALGGSPQGFSLIELRIPPIVMNGLMIQTEKQFSSSDRDIFVYDVMNPAKTKVTLQESEFDGENVLAISIFPKPILLPNEHTKVLVIARKEKGQ